MNILKTIFWKTFTVGKYILLPLMAGIYPILFHFANNLGVLGLPPFSQLGDLFIVLLLIPLAAFFLFYVIFRGQEILASIAGFIFVILFNLYGILFTWLHGLDVIQIEHYQFLPFFILLTIYMAWYISRQMVMRFSFRIWSATAIIVLSLFIVNLAKIVPYEIRQSQAAKMNATSSPAVQSAASDNNYPDIYYIIFDEFAGFDSIRNYWKYNEIDTFVSYLKSEGFYVAENSHSDRLSTINEIATRLNISTIAAEADDLQAYYEAINNNIVMQYFKELGYSTVVFDGQDYAWDSPEAIIADYSYQPEKIIKTGYLNNEFEVLVLKNTMVLPFLYNEKQDDPIAVRNRSMILYTEDQITKLGDIPGAKFVFVHLMIPHSPFLYTKEGAALDPQYYKDWNYYLGNYIYATTIIREIVSSLMAAYDPQHPPVIVLQSDHGARNSDAGYTNMMKDFPDEYRHLIMNALYLPGCDSPDLTQDMKPINTFPIIFNCYFEANMPMK
jgi:hypothetical protein